MQKMSWQNIEKEYATAKKDQTIASEIIAWSKKISEAKDFSVACMALIIIIIVAMILKTQK